MMIIWGIYALICFSAMMIYKILSNKEEFVELLEIEEETEISMSHQSVRLFDVFKTVKGESFSIILALFLQYLVFPGIYYALEVFGIFTL